MDAEKLLELLTSNTPVMPASNFWRATQRMKDEEHEGTLTPHLITPNLQNHKHLGGIIPIREFRAFLLFCAAKEIELNSTFMSGLQVQKKLKSKWPSDNLFANDRDVVLVTFEEKGDTPFAMLVAVSPRIFLMFKHIKASNELAPFIRKASLKPFFYPAAQNLRMDSLVRLFAAPSQQEIFMRLLPSQSKSERGERLRRKVSPLNFDIVENTISTLIEQGKPIQIGGNPFNISRIHKGRAAYSDDPDLPAIGTCEVEINMRDGGKRPVSSMQIDFNGTSHIADLLTSTIPTIRLRVNHLACDLTAQ